MAFLRQQPDVIAAYLFGSRATGRVHPGSDVDIAVLLDEDALPQTTGWGGPLLSRRLDLIAAAEQFADCEVDVITLNDASPLLSFEVLRKGRLLYEGNRLQRIEFEVRAGKIYNDLEPMYRFFNDALRKELKERGFGGRRLRSERTGTISAQ
ncbi:MAG: nucleotidyltransferase domain-containing protein [Chloroflexi bacterium]|nr:nucleotidyltransferase domain-containing protein [Chloroflexota bacterium]